MNKKIISILFCLTFINFVYSQSRYEEFLERGKQYEQDSLYFHALGNYYDAMVEEPTIKAEEAFKAFIALGEKLYNGLEYKDYESYWKNNCPYYVDFGSLQENGKNYELRTIKYQLNFNIRNTVKYNFFEKLKNCIDTNNSILNGTYKPPKESNPYERKVVDSIDMKINIEDENGIALLENCEGHFQKTMNYYYDRYELVTTFFWEQLPKEVTSKIKENKILIEVLECNYNGTGNFYDVPNNYNWKDSDNPIYKLYIEIEKSENYKKFAKNKKKIKSDFSILSKMIEIPELNIEVGATEVTQKLYKLVMQDNPSSFTYSENLPVESLMPLDLLIFCNRLSIAMGYSPCYFLNKTANPEKWKLNNETEDLYKLISEITYDKSKNGFRLPTEQEQQILFAKSGLITEDNKKIENIIDYSWCSEEITHEVGLKKSDSNGLFDFYGNVQEAVWKEGVRNNSYYYFYTNEFYTNNSKGFRLVRTIKSDSKNGMEK